MAGGHGAQPFPIRFTNEPEVAVFPETIWSLLVDPKAWPSFYPGVEHVQLPDRHDSLRLGTRFETNLAGQDVFASVQEFKPMTRIAWGGYPKVSEESKAYHGWIITPTPNGCHLWTEETMHGPHWIELAKKLPMPFGAFDSRYGASQESEVRAEPALVADDGKECF